MPYSEYRKLSFPLGVELFAVWYMLCASIVFIYKNLISFPSQKCPKTLTPSASMTTQVPPAQWSSEPLPVNLRTHCKIPSLNIEKYGKHAGKRFCFYAPLATLNILMFEAAAASGPRGTEAFPR